MLFSADNKRRRGRRRSACSQRVESCHKLLWFKSSKNTDTHTDILYTDIHTSVTTCQPGVLRVIIM